MSNANASLPKVSIVKIFLAFLAIGATSLGGGVVGYLRSSLVGTLKWLDDESFVELLSLCQCLPGLNASNMAILVGDRLRGVPGAAAALLGICLPGGLIMTAAAYALDSADGGSPLVNAALHGVSAAAVGMVLYVTVELGAKTIRHVSEAAITAATMIAVGFLQLPILLVLFILGVFATLCFRPRGADGGEDAK